MNKIIFFLCFLLLFSCKTRKYNYVNYYNKVNKIDSIYRFKNDTVAALNMYHKLFKKYRPHNSYLIDEYQTYIVLSDKYQKDFGGKESLYKLIPLVAPNWKYNRMDKNFFALYKKHGIDSIEIENKIADWKKDLDKKLVDSFSVAFYRNQEFRTPVYNSKLQATNDEKNAELLIRTFNEVGFPSLQKIGLWGNNGIFMPMGNMLNHMATRDTPTYLYFKEQLFKYLKNGECTPEDYAAMIDKYNLMTNEDSYGTFSNVPIKDSALVNRNRKKIGMPSLRHSRKIHKDYFKR
ncbi:hypothetical protein [Chryseobacterium echinoideorum]|uniref:hypothetical protein n=1 Tax=Chryseobacterium echinoideorum TaxID=1549648 RepID=UPI001E610C6C|nr:hypothetical protein [Chryseobacterium echinoideorum]